MKYLFFDIETVMGENINNRIVSFGYVLTDEQFKEIKKEDIFINPQEEMETINNWEWKQNATQGQQGFKSFYHKIKDLLTESGTIVVGHGTINDVQYLSDECDRYHFEPIDFNYLDTYKIAARLLPSSVSKKLKPLHDELVGNNCAYQWHRSLDDACMTKEVFEVLMDKAKEVGFSILDNDKFIFNSLRSIYGRMENVARKGEDDFSCNFDIPIIGLRLQCNYLKGDEYIREEMHLYYDYAVDRFFTPKHPKKGSRQEDSVLQNEAYEIAKRRAVYKVNKMWDAEKKMSKPGGFFYREGYQMANLRIKHLFYSLTSYEVYASFQQNFLAFDFNIAMADSYFKNAVESKEGKKFNLKRIIKNVHSAETANRSLCLMAKMKFGYKDRAFLPIEEEPYVYQDGDRFCLAKTYYSLLQDPATKRGENDRLINNEKEYIPTRQKVENNFFDEPFEIPVLVERDLNKG